MAITAITTKKLDEHQVSDFDDYARYLPSVSYQTAGPGYSNVYFRGVASGENANHSTSLPSVGTYLDEQPITTITGAIDIHVVDIARVEALAGPQGTLYGASSQAGTIRIITNKPDTSGFYGEANVEVNNVAHGEWGYVAEAFANMPISENVAARVVGWVKRDAGYIDNIPGRSPSPPPELSSTTASSSRTITTMSTPMAPAPPSRSTSTTHGPCLRRSWVRSRRAAAYAPRKRAWASCRFSSSIPNDRWINVSRLRSPSRARSGISTSPMPAPI